jgi:hypothetical protein
MLEVTGQLNEPGREAPVCFTNDSFAVEKNTINAPTGNRKTITPFVQPVVYSLY